MSDPQRWLGGGADAPEEIRALLKAAQKEGPTIAQKAGLGAKLGLPASGIFASLGAKGALATATMAAGALGVAVAQFQATPNTSYPPPEEPRVTSYAPPAQEPLELAPQAPPVIVEAEPVEETEPAPVSRVQAVQAPTQQQIKVAAPDKPSEVSLIRVARDQIESSPQSALSILKRHQALYPSGLLAQERKVLMIEALANLGEQAQAKEQARAFRAEHPESGHDLQQQRAVPD